MIFIGLAPDITGILPKTVILTNNFLRQRYISITEDFSKSFFWQSYIANTSRVSKKNFKLNMCGVFGFLSMFTGSQKLHTD